MKSTDLLLVKGGNSKEIPHPSLISVLEIIIPGAPRGEARTESFPRFLIDRKSGECFIYLRNIAITKDNHEGYPLLKSFKR